MVCYVSTKDPLFSRRHLENRWRYLDWFQLLGICTLQTSLKYASRYWSLLGAMLEGKLIMIPALGHKKKRPEPVKLDLPLFWCLSAGIITSLPSSTWSLVAKGLLKQKLNHLVPRTSFFGLVFGTSLKLSQDLSLSGQFSDFVFPSEWETELPATFIPVFQCFRGFSSGRNLWLFTRGKGGEYRQNLAMFHYFW